MPLRRSFGLFSTTLLPLATLALWPRTGAAVPTEPGTLTNDLAESTSCQNCHSFPNAFEHGADPQYAPYFGWQGTLMANAARDPFFRAVLAAEAQRAGKDRAAVEAKCLHCHAPMKVGKFNAGEVLRVRPVTLGAAKTPFIVERLTGPTGAVIDRKKLTTR